ncbi:uncharacterized protein DS421_17g596160 [Arachis hypogaea]|nr:uncharacterized protein DS421_17g596160 [Arachis hypogaea]
MALSRRPARFTRRPDSMQHKTISEEQLESLRAAAAGIYTDKQNPEEDKYPVHQEVMGIKMERVIKKEHGDDDVKVDREVAHEDTKEKESPKKNNNTKNTSITIGSNSQCHK